MCFLLPFPFLSLFNNFKYMSLGVDLCRVLGESQGLSERCQKMSRSRRMFLQRGQPNMAYRRLGSGSTVSVHTEGSSSNS